MKKYLDDYDAIFVEGKEFSKETVKAALTAHAKFEEDKPYIFKAGDVARNAADCRIRIICSRTATNQMVDLYSIDLNGTLCSVGQLAFEAAGYVFIGELSDFLPKDENG